MFLVNETPFSAELLRTVIDEDRIMASVIARVTYELADATAATPLAIAAEQPWPVSPAPWDSPQGPMESDVPFMKGGVDLHLFGSARAPNRAPVSQMQIVVEVGSFVRRANVFGNRVWIRPNGRDFVPSKAAPFVEMALTLAHAFGGKVEWDGLEVPWMENAKGLGFWIDEANVEGRPLPNLEEPHSPMNLWSDKPEICGFGFCPMASAARFKNGTLLTEEYEIQDFRPQIFNTAYPPMIAPDAKGGDVVRVTGVRHEGPLELVLPASPVAVRLRFGAKVAERVLTIDQIGIEVEERRVFVTYRFPFRYVVRERELREATLIPSEQ